MFSIKPVCIIGFLEHRHNGRNAINTNIINPKILEYYNVKKYYKSNVEVNRHEQNMFIFSLDYLHSNIENYIELDIVYGVEINIIQVIQKNIEVEYDKEIAEIQIKNFSEFMYKHYNVEFEEPTETLALDICQQSNNIYVDSFLECTDITPDDINIYEYDIKITLINGGMKTGLESPITLLSKDIYKQFYFYIIKAGFKLNASSVLEESDNVENSSIIFNINASENIKTWIHSMKRKIRKKFHIIKSIEYETKFRD